MRLQSTLFKLAAVAAIAQFVGCATVPPPPDLAIEPEADAVLKAMSQKLANAKRFSLETSRTIDASLVEGRSGIREQVSGDVSVARPNKLRARSRSGGVERVFAYDGRRMLVWDKSASIYASVPTGSTITKMVDDLDEKWGFNPPLADLMVDDPYRSLTGGGGEGRLVGTERIGGVTCHHVSFSNPGVDWDLWIAKSDSLPRKFVITFTGQPGSPKIVSRMWNWNLSASHPEGHFNPNTGDATEVEMIPR